MSNLTWLTVGGCARSGTTALGDALRRSRSIQLFHEVRPRLFFDSIDSLFTETRRLSVHADWSKFRHLMPVEERDLVPIVRGVFEAVFGEEPVVVGCKLPRFYMEPPPEFPPGITGKIVMITRNPYDAILSYGLKRQEQGTAEPASASFHTALAEWVSGWNYAVEHFGTDGFHHVLYEDLDGIGNARIAREIAEFLDIECDFDLAGITPKCLEDWRVPHNAGQASGTLNGAESSLPNLGLHKIPDVADRFGAVGMTSMFETIGEFFSYEHWREQANRNLQDRASAIRLDG